MSLGKLLIGLSALLGGAGAAMFQVWKVINLEQISVVSGFGFYSFAFSIALYGGLLLFVFPYCLLHFPWWRLSARPTIWGNAERPRKRISR